MSSHYVKEPQIKIDLRNHMPSIRDQGQKPLCLAFAMSDANSAHQKIVNHLSVEYLAYHACRIGSLKDYSGGLDITATREALLKNGQPDEMQWPCINNGNLVPNLPPQGLQPIYCANANPVTGALSAAESVLATGRPLIACLRITNQFRRPFGAPYILYDTTSIVGNHAVVVVGVGHYADGENFFLIRNSWGSKWGKDGHAWITAGFFEKNQISVLTLQ